LRRLIIMRRHHFIASIGFVFGLLFLVTSCGDDAIEQGTTGPPSDDSGSVSSPPQTGDTPPAPGNGAAAIRSRSDLVDARPVEPESVTSDPSNNKRLLVRFWGGVEPCFGAELRVVESATEVKVTVLGGAPPDARDRTCIALAKLYEGALDLRDPLGSRTITVTK
jgi:hypothetical protein